MTWHYDILALVDLDEPAADMQSPSRFVRAVKDIPGVREAFRSVGRWDAVVWIHHGHDGPEEKQESHDPAKARASLAKALQTARRVQGVKGVRTTSLLMGRPDETGPHQSKV